MKTKKYHFDYGFSTINKQYEPIIEAKSQKEAIKILKQKQGFYIKPDYIEVL